MIPDDSVVLLDPVAVFHIAVGDSLGNYLVSEYKLLSRKPRPMISLLTVGEILRLAHYLQYGAHELVAVEELLKGYEMVQPYAEIVQEYGRLGATIDLGMDTIPSEKLWVAATCSTVGKGARPAVLLTCDASYNPIAKYGLTIEYVDPTPWDVPSHLT